MLEYAETDFMLRKVIIKYCLCC